MGLNHHAILERQHSSSGCSTSYAAATLPISAIRTSCRRQRWRSRCTAQARPYRGSQSPERDPARRSGQPHRPLGSVVTNAVTATPASARHGNLRSESSKLDTSIPDAIPSLEQLEDLRSRAMQAARGKTSRVGRDGPSASPAPAATSNPLRIVNARCAPNNDSFGSSDEGDGFLAPDDPPADPPRAERDMSPAPGESSRPSAPPPATRAAPGRAVLPPQPPVRAARSSRSDSSSAGFGAAGQGRKVALSPKRPSAPVPPRQSAAAPVMQRTLTIKSERDWRQLPGLLADLASSGGLDAFTASTFLTHLAQLVAKQPPVSNADVVAVERMQGILLDSVEYWMHEYRARQISNMTWALARLGLPSGAAFVREHLLPASYPLLPWYEPQHLSNTLWALATVDVAPDDTWLEEYLTVAFVALQKRALAPQHLANVLWALERMGVMPDQEWMAAYYDCAQAAVPAANPQDCSNILSCLALMRMHEQRPAATADLAGHLARRLQALLAPDAVGPAAAAPPAADAAVLTPTPAHSAGGGLPEPAGASVDVSDQAIANSLWALAIMGVQPVGGLWEAIVGALRQRLAAAGGMHPVALTIVLWASATLGRPLPAAVTGLLYGKVRAAQMASMEPRSLATMVWALATAPREQARPPADWVADAMAVSERSLTQLGSQAVSNMLYGLCQLGARPPPAWMSAVVNHFHRNLGAEASGQSVSNVLWCLAKMGYRLNTEGMDILFGLVRKQLAAWQQQAQAQLAPRSSSPPPPPPFTSQEVSNVLYAIASMGYEMEPEGELAGLLLQAARARLGNANAQELSNIMWCLAALQIRPSQPWLDDYYVAAQARLPTFKPFDLAQALYGAAKLHLPLQPLPPDQPATATATAAESPEGPPAVSPAAASWMRGALSAAPQLLATANAQDLCNLSWALVQLRVPVATDSPLASAFAARLVSLSAACEPSQLALGVWALGKWRARPSRSQMERLELATFRQVPSMRPHELAAMLSGFAGMGHVAPTEWLSDAMQQVAARSREFGPQEWTMVVYALGRVQNDNSLTEAVLRLLPRLDRLPLPSLILIAYSCGCMGPSPMGRQLVRRCLSLLAAGGVAAQAAGDSAADAGGGTQRGATPAGEAQRHAGRGRGFGSAPVAKADGAAAMRGSPAASRRGGGAAEAAAGAPEAAGTGTDGATRPVSMTSLTATELSALLWSAVRVGIKVLPEEFVGQFYRHTQPMLEGLPASLVASYLWAAGRLRMWLPARWRQALMRQAEARLPEMRPRELTQCMAGLLWLRVWPSSSLLRKLQACYEAQRPQMPERLCKHADEALRVLIKRKAEARRRERKHGASLAARKLWLAHVRKGNSLAAAADTNGYRGRPAATAPPGHMSNRVALRLGVLRKAPARAKAAKSGAQSQ
ncbi:hypothetical protein PLESTB_000862800 [Pleodorina starrii]|uniref:Tbc2 translation factor, chloroplastic n=1 Tax=Pleodorina starrii TaxID=330485 RepID=A0A9W6BLR6_9CHLO|nr:hypothetical protein PLESTM_001431200 [Pleodorina starrii]GLC54429.1 hypothetical protein PLESTB_000862800 [Pleodorina starrii]GLC72084.1 hypothetical protein PLESTF_001202200 [Pleodorina starrii]